MAPFTSISEVERIAGLSDPVLRNLQITQSYHELSLVIAGRTGPCANWCTFATWASRQAGQTIRAEDLTEAIENAFNAAPAISQAMAEIVNAALLKGAAMGKEGIAKLVWDTIDPKAAMDRASTSVARGNQKVYAEIAREFARFVEACLNDEAYDADNIGRFCVALRPGDPPDGQRYLRLAFSRYYQAFFEPDQKKKAEHILLANLEIGFHEQTRLQPEIAEALEASVEDPQIFKRRLLNTLFPTRSWIMELWALFMAFIGRPTPLDDAIQQFSELARHHIRLFLTDHLMELAFPKGLHLRLGHDLQARFPASLQHLANTELIALLKQIDPTPDSLQETGAIDWADLPDRLHFIADLFRCYQETTDLLSPPFEPEQAEAILAGRRP
ncbi:MAG: hypothetical protein H6566_06115 [Lewinellaceae bacterium]|nr:hypothetical protein [Lewinellaceae bacterium]